MVGSREVNGISHRENGIGGLIACTADFLKTADTIAERRRAGWGDVLARFVPTGQSGGGQAQEKRTNKRTKSQGEGKEKAFTAGLRDDVRRMLGAVDVPEIPR